MNFEINISGQTVISIIKLFMFGLLGWLMYTNGLGVTTNPYPFLEITAVVVAIDVLARVQGTNGW